MKTLIFFLTTFFTLNSWANADCTFFVDDTLLITSHETEVSRLMVDSTMIALENGQANIGMMKAKLMEKGPEGWELTIADSYSGSRMNATFPATALITGSESGAALKVKLSETTGNFEVGSVLYIGAKKTLIREASVYCFE